MRNPRPVTLPQQAWGPQPLEYAANNDRPAVRVWVQFNVGPARRCDALAVGWNDQVVIVELVNDGGMQPVVWRTAVSKTA